MHLSWAQIGILAFQCLENLNPDDKITVRLQPTGHDQVLKFLLASAKAKGAHDFLCQDVLLHSWTHLVNKTVCFRPCAHFKISALHTLCVFFSRYTLCAHKHGLDKMSRSKKAQWSFSLTGTIRSVVQVIPTQTTATDVTNLYYLKEQQFYIYTSSITRLCLGRNWSCVVIDSLLLFLICSFLRNRNLLI